MNGYFYYEGGILKHSGKKGSKWGYTNGVPNGNRTAEFVSSYVESLQNTPDVIKKSYGKSKVPYIPLSSRIPYSNDPLRKKLQQTEDWERERRYRKKNNKKSILDTIDYLLALHDN